MASRAQANSGAVSTSPQANAGAPPSTPARTPTITDASSTASDPDEADVLQLATEGRLREAFNKALNTARLPLLRRLCRRVNAAALFKAQPPVLDQTHVLSLMAQLSAGLLDDPVLHLAWLSQALPTIESDDARSRQVLSLVGRNVSHARSAAGPELEKDMLDLLRGIRSKLPQ